jgi:hypothetical protein
MKTYPLVALGCLFWLFPLALATRWVLEYGFYEEGFGFDYDLALLLAVPIVMIALTLTLGWLANRCSIKWPAIVTASLASVCACLVWIAIWGKGV